MRVVEVHVMEMSNRVLGAEHTETLTSMNKPSSTRAVSRCSEDEKRSGGKGKADSRRRASRHHRSDERPSQTLGELGQLDEAVTMLEVTVEEWNQVLGARHRYTKIATRNLA
jgi:IS5 family transposase